MYKLLLVFLCLVSPALCLADGDDGDGVVEITENDLDDPDGDINIDIEGDTPSGIDQAVKDVHDGKTVSVMLKDGRIVIDSSRETVVPVYRIDVPVVRMFRVNSGTNVLPLPHGLYVVMGKKYLLR